MWLCEVSTHLDGLLYGNSSADTLAKVRQKVERAVDFAERMFPGQERRFEVWAPKASRSLVEGFDALATELARAETTVDFVVNESYTKRVQELITRARSTTSATGEPFYRTLQILTHLSGGPPRLA